MKKLGLFLIPTILLFSCADEGITINEGFPQKWVLVQMSGQTQAHPTTGADMEWQEFYEFGTDMNFTKQRTRDGIMSETSGSFTLVANSEEAIYELQFDTESEIIGSCLSGNREILRLQPNDILTSTWQNCDGPGLEYERE